MYTAPRVPTKPDACHLQKYLNRKKTSLILYMCVSIYTAADPRALTRPVAYRLHKKPEKYL